MSMTPTQLTLRHMRKEGWTACVVEKWIPMTKRRQDAFGFGDVLACHGDYGVALVQTTSQSNRANRVTKVLGTPEAKDWCDAGGMIYVHGWAKKLVHRAGKKRTWQVEVTDIGSRDFKAVDKRTLIRCMPKVCITSE